MRWLAVSLITMVPLALSNLYASALLDDWRPRNPLPTASDLTGVVFGNGHFVAVGNYGTVLTSSDGQVWLEHVQPTNQFTDIAFGVGIFVATGYGGISSSSDGLTWSRRNPLTANRIAYINGQFVGVVGNQILRSSDAGNWSTVTLTNWLNLTDVTFGNGLYVAIGQSGLDPELPPAPAMLISSDGTNWVTQSTGTLPVLSRIAFGDGTFVAAGNGRIFVSSDASSWTEVLTGSGKWFWDLRFIDGVFLAVGDPTTLLTSANGRTWTPRTTTPSSSLQCVTYGLGEFVAVGSGGRILTSPNALDWVQLNPSPEPRLFKCLFANGEFVAVGGVNTGAFIFTSANGFKWQPQAFPGVFYFRGITYGDGRFVAVGSQGALSTSPDGLAWTLQNSGLTNLDFTDVTYGANQFVVTATTAFGTSAILTSLDGMNWVIRYRATNEFLYGITYRNGRYVAVGGNLLVAADPSIVLTSEDGIVWTHRATGTMGTLGGVAFGNGLFMAVGLETSAIVTSPDGLEWTGHLMGSSDFLNGVTFGEGEFLAVGTAGAIFTSADGVAWTRRTNNRGRELWAAAFGSENFIAVGDSGTILQTAQPRPRFCSDATRRSNDGIIRFIVETPAGIDITVEASEDLKAWMPTVSVTNSPGLFEFADLESQTNGQRLYRAKQTSH